MNAKELRDAAERLRCNEDRDYVKMSPLLYFADCETLAKGYLATVHADDDELIDEAWFWKVARSDTRFIYLSSNQEFFLYYRDIGQVELCCEETARTTYDPGSTYCGECDRPIKTRKQLRDLCRCLGIEVPE